MNISELTCRVCLEDGDIMINIYDELEDLNSSVSKLLETCADLQINENDSFPKYLCEDCTRELLISYQFREKCVKSKQILCALLENTNVIGNEELSHSNDLIEYCIEDASHIDTDDLIIHEPENVKESPEVNTEILPVEQILFHPPLRNSIFETINAMEPYTNSVNNNSKEDSNFNQLDSKAKSPAEMSLDNTATMTIKSLRAKRDHMFKCDICGAKFKQTINLQKHLQKSHDFINCYTCANCGHCFSLETEFNKHVEDCNYLEIISGIADKSKAGKVIGASVEIEENRKCMYCVREFPTPFALRMHIRTHTGERPFHCKYCTKSFKTQSQLNVHHKRHSGQADFICTICNKTFYEQSNLIVHMRSHTGERPHVCTICNKTFNRVFLLQIHMRIHAGEKPFKCNYCDKSFRQLTDLRNHLTTHTGEKQHACTLCKKSYVKRSHLLKHMRKQHIHSNSLENDDVVNLENEDSAEELNTAINNIQSCIPNRENLINFDEIIESEIK